MEPKQGQPQFGGQRGSFLQGPEGGRNGIAAAFGINFEYVHADLEFGTNNFKDTNGNVLSASAAIEKIRDTERGKIAMFFARKKANDFANRVYDEFTKKEEQKAGRADVLENVAAAEGFKVEVTPPFEL